MRIRSRDERKCGKGHMRKHNSQRLPRSNGIYQFLHWGSSVNPTQNKKRQKTLTIRDFTT